MSKWIHNVKKGFTLIELLVVIAIIAILAAILVPAVNRALIEGRLTTMINNGRNIYLAIKSDELSNVLGGRSPWPRRGTLNEQNREFPNSTDYFRWVVTNNILAVDFSFFSAPGMTSHATTDHTLFTQAGNAWCVTAGVNSTTRDTAPVLFTRNVGSGTADIVTLSSNMTVNLRADAQPFGDRGGALVLMGGSSTKLSRGFDVNQFNAAGATNAVLYPQ